MKYMIISDIHGSEIALEKALNRFEQLGCDYLMIGGDVLNYGPRNPIPAGLNPQGVAKKLNRINKKIIAVRGNCESEVDQMLLDFPCMSDYALIADEGVRIFLTHGHIYNPANMPKGDIDILICGHSHLWRIEKVGNTICCNVGSITLPKGGNPATFGIYENKTLSILSLEQGEILEKHTIDFR